MATLKFGSRKTFIKNEHSYMLNIKRSQMMQIQVKYAGYFLTW